MKMTCLEKKNEILFDFVKDLVEFVN